MADTVAEAKDVSKVSSPEKKKEEKKVEAVDEDSKTSENGDGDKPRENGTVDEAADDDSKDAEPESTENGDVKASPTASAKRKSAGAGDAPEVTTPEKKAKVDEKADSAEANGEAEATA